MGVLMLGAGLQGTLLGLRATLEGFSYSRNRHHHVVLLRGLIFWYFGPPRLLRQIDPSVCSPSSRPSRRPPSSCSGIRAVHRWAVMRLLSGVCFAGIYVVAESWLNDRASKTNRGRLLAVYMLVLYVGLGAAQFLLILANPSTPTPFMLVSVLISLSMVPIALSATQVPEARVAEEGELTAISIATRRSGSWRFRSRA